MANDLNLLIIFEALWQERNVERAGRRLGIGQPAMSAKLAKLRHALHDPLFVRQARGLSPTPRAMEIASGILGALEACRLALRSSERFDPKKANDTVVIAATDYFDLLVLPALIARLLQEAPHLRVITRTLRGDLPRQELESGSIDLAIAGYFQGIPEGYFQQSLFEETYHCVVRQDHPAVDYELSLETYLALSHLLISPRGDLTGVVDRVLEAKGLSRRVVAGIGNFHAPGAIIASSDLVLTAPSRLLQMYGSHLPLKTLRPPFDVPGFSVVQVWHHRTHKDPLRAWVRSVIKEIAATLRS